MKPDLRAWAAPLILAALAAQPIGALAAPAAAAYRTVPGGTIKTLLPPDGKQAPVTVADFSMRVLPVTHAEFAQFVQKQPQWRKSRAADTSLADGQYLKSWLADTAPSPAQRHQWEYAAAADHQRRDARADPLWRARILDWYGQTSRPLPEVGRSAKNVYGLQDLHGVIWEWVDDFSALMVSGDNRTQGDPDTLQFCGAGALSATDRENYPVLMRIAMLSSLKAASTNRNLGFRCVKEPKALKGVKP
jgi:formylglycine-generating enzyme